MLSESLLQVLLICLLAVPTVGAVIVACLGPRREHLIRWTSLAAALLPLALAAILAWQLFARRIVEMPPSGGVSVPTFYPEFVPGSPGADGHRHSTSWDLLRIGEKGAIQFYIGL